MSEGIYFDTVLGWVAPSDVHDSLLFFAQSQRLNSMSDAIAVLAKCGDGQEKRRRFKRGRGRPPRLMSDT